MGRRKKELTDEALHIKNLELETKELIRRNSKAISDKFYGERLRVLMNFYDRKMIEICKLIGIRSYDLSSYVNNIRKPSIAHLDKICFFFEIDKAYFTQHAVEIRITEQLKIEFINKISKPDKNSLITYIDEI